MLGLKAKLAGFEPVPLQQTYPIVDDLLSGIRKARVYGALCDHRLREGNYAGFDGAAAVAGRSMMTRSRQSLLLTMERSTSTLPSELSGAEYLSSFPLARLFRIASYRDWRPRSEVVLHEIPISRCPTEGSSHDRRGRAEPERRAGDRVRPSVGANEAVSFPELDHPGCIESGTQERSDPHCLGQY